MSAVTGSLLFYSDVSKEGQNNIMKFGDDYRGYMARVPRLNLLAGIMRLVPGRSRRNEEDLTN